MTSREADPIPALVDAPAALRDLAGYLAGQGMAVNDHPELAVTKSRLVDFTHTGGLMVRMVCDEGRWSLVAGRAAWADWFEADYWEACLSNRDLPRVASPLDQQARWVQARLATLLDLPDGGPVDCLRNKRRQDAVQAMGLF